MCSETWTFLIMLSLLLSFESSLCIEMSDVSTAFIGDVSYCWGSYDLTSIFNTMYQRPRMRRPKTRIGMLAKFLIESKFVTV